MENKCYSCRADIYEAARRACGGDKKTRERVDSHRMHCPEDRRAILLKVARGEMANDNVTENCVIDSTQQAQAQTQRTQKTRRIFIIAKPKIMSLLFFMTTAAAVASHHLLLLVLLSSSAAGTSQATVADNSTFSSSSVTKKTNNEVGEPPRAHHHHQFKLDCQPGEQRQFSYESSTKVWGSSDQQVRLRALLRLKCMEPPTNSSLKYLAEIVSVQPNFVYQDEPLQSSKLQRQQKEKVARPREMSRSQFSTPDEYARRQKLARRQAATVEGNANSGRSQQLSQHNSQLRIPHELEVDQLLRAEPLLEEVGEVAIRMKRSVSGWFSKAWVSVKDFFGNIFTSSERSSVSRDQVFKESGLDIAGQCKASSSSSSSSSSSHKGKGGAVGLPFDESVFEDLGPEYYVGASLDGASGLEFLTAGHVSTFGPASEDGEDPELMTLSFFDDPPPLRRRGDTTRTKRAAATTGGSGHQKNPRTTTGAVVVESSGDHERLLKVPFVFIQSRSGKIVEIRFSGDETDLSVKNFKRHLCDLFATNLDWNKTTQNEVSPIGKHQTKYTLDASANSMDTMKRTMLDSGDGNLLGGENDHEERTNKQQLVRVLATLATSDRRFLGNHTKPPGIQEDEDDAEGGEGEGEIGDGGGAQSPVQRRSLSVLRSINTTSGIQQMGSKVAAALASEIDRMQVRVKQVQQINEGRLVGTAGQLSMSLVQMADQRPGGRNKRQVPARADDLPAEQVDDISDLLKVSTSFSMQLVPIAISPDGSIADDADHEEASTDRSHRSRRSTPDEPGDKKRASSSSSKKRRSAVKLAPADAQELQRVLQDWRKQEARLQLSPANLMSENHSGLQESQTTRLDILRDQIRQRLNEEFVRNRIRRSLSMQQVAVAASAARTSDTSSSRANLNDEQKQQTRPVLPPGGDLGLGLTQLVLGTGVTTRRKGSIYAQLEEALELEAQLVDDHSESAISKLMRDTLKMGKLREHCRSSVPSLEELTASGFSDSGAPAAMTSNYERRLPFGFKDEKAHEREEIRARAGKRARQVEKFAKRNDRKLEQCQQMLRLVLKLNDKQAVDLVLELIDVCNSRLVAAAKQEELGYGPVSKYFRRQRQHFLELLAHVGRPTDTLLDKLLSRLYHYPKLVPTGALAGATRRPQSSQRGQVATGTSPRPEPEFVYLTKEQRDQGHSTSGGGGGGATNKSQFNKSLLREEDDFNNNDGAGLLVMTLTSLAAKSSISRLKRLEVAEKLLGSLKGTTCSLFSSPDLDILESMASFQEPLDEIVGRILQLARKCKQHDQYVVACVHGLSGQLHHAGTQRLLGDLLRAPNASCTVKSEIVLTLISAQLIDDLKQQYRPLTVNKSSLDAPLTGWPGSVGFNKIDEILLEIVDSRDRMREPDRRCLAHLVTQYLSRNPSRRQQQVVGPPASTTTTPKPMPASSRRAERRSFRLRRRAESTEQNGFWDDAQCKRWSMPADGSNPFGPASDHNHLPPSHLFSEADYGSAVPSANNNNNSSSITDLIDEIDDNSILSAIIDHNQRQRQGRTSSGSSRRQQKLVERELESSVGAATWPAGHQSQAQTAQLGQNNSQQVAPLRRRHKCVASKDFGPKNAQATLKAEIVNDLVGPKDENKFLARFRLATNFLGQRIDVGRMYLWHQRRTTRAYANILGRSIWDTSHGCKDKPPSQVLYMPLFDFSLWLVKISVGLRLNAEMGFFPNCDPQPPPVLVDSPHQPPASNATSSTGANPQGQARNMRHSADGGGGIADELQLYPTITLRAAGEATAKLVVARAGMSLASQYSYQGDIRVSRQPESCMSIYSAHQPMNITFSSWFQLWDNDCHFWGSRARAEPQATKWRLTGQKPIAWLENECLSAGGSQRTETNGNSTSGAAAAASARLIPPPNQISP